MSVRVLPSRLAPLALSTARDATISLLCEPMDFFGRVADGVFGLGEARRKHQSGGSRHHAEGRFASHLRASS